MTAPTPPPTDPEPAHETPDPDVKVPDPRETDHPAGNDHAAANIDNEPPG